MINRKYFENEIKNLKEGDTFTISAKARIKKLDSNYLEIVTVKGDRIETDYLDLVIDYIEEFYE
jgi:hypothetical protein